MRVPEQRLAYIACLQIADSSVPPLTHPPQATIIFLICRFKTFKSRKIRIGILFQHGFCRLFKPSGEYFYILNKVIFIMGLNFKL